MSLTTRNGDDRIYTPDPLAQSIVDHFKPAGSVLEPCRGGGAFIRALQSYNNRTRVLSLSGIHWCELDEGSDFLAWQTHVDWIITNPPWSKFRAFLQHSMQVADNVVFLCLINHMLTRARVRDIRTAGFMFSSILFCPTPPPPWPQAGLALAVVHIRRGSKSDYFGPETCLGSGVTMGVLGSKPI